MKFDTMFYTVFDLTGMQEVGAFLTNTKWKRVESNSTAKPPIMFEWKYIYCTLTGTIIM